MDGLYLFYEPDNGIYQEMFKGFSQKLDLSARTSESSRQTLPTTYSGSGFYKVSRNLVILFFVLLLILELLFVRELINIRQEEEAGQARQRLQLDLEYKTRQNLKEKLAEKERQLTVATLALEEKNKMLSNIQFDLKDLPLENDVALRSKLRPLSRKIDYNLKSRQDQIQFQEHFSKVHPGFYEQLRKQFPSLNTNDLRLCAYLRMNLSNKEIARLLHINPNSAQKARYRLKKKLGLGRDACLQGFIAAI